MRLTSAGFALSSLFTIAAILLSANLNDAGWPRYLLWPAFAGLLGVALFAATARWLAGLALLACAVAVGGAVHPLGWTLHPASDFALRRDVACVDALADREDAHVVVGQYWVAKPVTLLSRRGVKVAQFEPDLHDVSLWLTSRAWFFPSAQAGLVITNGLAAEAVERLGADFEPVDCGKLNLRVYRGQARHDLKALLDAKVAHAIGTPRWLKSEAGGR